MTQKNKTKARKAQRLKAKVTWHEKRTHNRAIKRKRNKYDSKD